MATTQSKVDHDEFRIAERQEAASSTRLALIFRAPTQSS